MSPAGFLSSVFRLSAVRSRSVLRATHEQHRKNKASKADGPRAAAGALSGTGVRWELDWQRLMQVGQAIRPSRSVASQSEASIRLLTEAAADSPGPWHIVQEAKPLLTSFLPP